MEWIIHSIFLESNTTKRDLQSQVTIYAGVCMPEKGGGTP